jgi:anti-anti-sigma factor
MEAELKIQVDRLDRATLEISAYGPLDERTVSNLRRGELGRGDDSADLLLFNLSGVERIDAAGLAALMLARVEIEARGGAMVVLASGARILRALDRAGLRRFVDIAATRPAALRMLSPRV